MKDLIKKVADQYEQALMAVGQLEDITDCPIKNFISQFRQSVLNSFAVRESLTNEEEFCWAFRANYHEIKYIYGTFSVEFFDTRTDGERSRLANIPLEIVITDKDANAYINDWISYRKKFLESKETCHSQLLERCISLEIELQQVISELEKNL